MMMLGRRSFAFRSHASARASTSSRSHAFARAPDSKLGLGSLCAYVVAALLGGCAEQHQEDPEPTPAVTEPSDSTEKEQENPEPGGEPVRTDAGIDAGTSVAQDDAGGGVTEPPVSDACGPTAARWIEIAQTNCVACHGRRSAGKGGFYTVLDVDALIAGGKVVPGQPESSPIFLKVSSGAMPPPERTQRPSADDVEAMRAWIACGAPKVARQPCELDCTTFVDISTRLDLLVNDLQAQPADQRADVRYLDLSVQANAGQGEAKLELYRDGLSYLLNSLSSNPKIAVPQAVDSQGLLFRIRLSDYGWNAATWERVAAGYPYNVTYDPNSRTFPIEEVDAQRLRELTGTDTPYLEADWFFSKAVRPPLYYDVLGMPAQLGQLEAALGIDIDANIAEGGVVRAGFQDSGPSRFNRVIERHSLGDARGALWLTYDFTAGAGTSNVVTHPRDFRASSSEVLFNLPNGLYGYMIVSADGTRLNKAPNDAVQDPDSRDLAIESGISCISCHTEQGVIAHDDDVRKAALVTAPNSSELDDILQLYVDDERRNAIFAEDQARYHKAALATRIHQFGDRSAHVLDNAYVGLLGLKDIAGVIGIPSDKLAAAIDATPRVFPPEFVALRAVDSRLPRESFDSVFGALVVGLGLGEPRAAQ